jgi:hypothetical protein
MVGRKSLCEKCRPEYVDDFVKSYEREKRKEKTFLNLTIYSGEKDCRYKPDYPFLHAHLEAPFAEVAEKVAQQYKVNFYELHLHMNTKSILDIAYRDLVEDWALVSHFLKSGHRVYLWLEPEDEPVLKQLRHAGLITKKRHRGTVSASWRAYSEMVFRKAQVGHYQPRRFEIADAGEFLVALNKMPDMGIMKAGSAGFYHEFDCSVKEDETYQDTLRRLTIDLLMLAREGEPLPQGANE